LRRACEVFLEVGPVRAEQLALSHADVLDDAATAAGLSVLSDRRDASGNFGPQRSAIISLRLNGGPGSPPYRLPDQLRAANVTFSVREGALRLSPHWYNVKEEIERVCELIRSCRVPIASAIGVG
jgi:selenocysteine lyase/cysteine desulfurase